MRCSGSLVLGLAWTMSLTISPPGSFGMDAELTTQIYVDPVEGRDESTGASVREALRTLSQAQRAARDAVARGAKRVEVLLSGGEYVLREPLRFGPLDSGGGEVHVTYAAMEGHRPVIMGGIEVSGWTVHDAELGIYRVKLPESVKTRSLFVNGVRATRARSVTGLTDAKLVDDGHTCSDVEMLEWKNASEVELVYRVIWTNPRVGVATIGREGDLVKLVMDQPGFANGRGKGITGIKLPWYIENAYELLDEPGEWYLDASGAVNGTPDTLYYKPQAWEDLETARVMVPVTEDLVVVKGDSLDALVENITIRGIEFAYSTWLRPSSEFGLPDAQNNVMRENKTKGGEFTAKSAAITVKHARGITIEGCHFRSLGGIGVAMYAGTKDSRIEGCSFRDIAGTGIQIGDYFDFENPASENYSYPEDERLHISGLRIANNYVTRTGAEYRSSTGIALAYVRDSLVAHNEIHNVPYTGMHIGWGWERAKRTVTGHLRIESNLVRNTMVELADGGCYYTLGRSDELGKPNLMIGNVAQQARYGQGYYLDEASQYWRLSENVSELISDHNLKVNGISSDIVVDRMYVDRERTTIAKVAERIEVGPMILLSSDTEGAADRIRANAGLQPGYESLRIGRVDQVIHEAEDGMPMGGALATSPWKDVYGYSGMGYMASLDGRKNAGVRFDVNVSKAGRYRVAIRYQSPGVDSPGWQLKAGDVTSEPIALEATGDRKEWGTVRSEISLAEGQQPLTLTAPAGVGTGAVVDRIELTHVEP